MIQVCKFTYISGICLNSGTLVASVPVYANLDLNITGSDLIALCLHKQGRIFWMGVGQPGPHNTAKFALNFSRVSESFYFRRLRLRPLKIKRLRLPAPTPAPGEFQDSKLRFHNHHFTNFLFNFFGCSATYKWLIVQKIYC